ncbi:large ribosomal subunit protein mL38-like isoform X1 [Columba livia]|uniref:large ribosomal subunit protein mL38-like isoform X1 n=1 Tax=Columba livia TaxID=8932 RepID=UPI0031BB1505
MAECDFSSGKNSLYCLFACQTGCRLCHNVAQSDVQSWGNVLALTGGNEWIYSEVNLCVFRTNIPGNDIQSGKEICHYLPPFPAMGTGYHRFIFLLFKQDRRVDFSEDVRPTPCHSLKMRTFSTFDLYRKHEDAMTPACLAFFQCQWDSCVSWVFHQLLNMREPVFEFVRPPVYHPPQVKFPRHQPLRYLDRYRDSKEPTYGIY